MVTRCRSRWVRSCWLVLGLVALASLPSVIAASRSVLAWRELRSLTIELQDSLEALKHRKPNHATRQQWDQAIDWTTNLVSQVFFAPNLDEMTSLRVLNQEFAKRVQEPVDLTTLQWVWDQIEQCDERQDDTSCAVRFRDARLLTLEPITDENLPSLWALDRLLILDLHDTQVSDASLATLSRLTRLRWLSLSGTAMSRSGIDELRNQLPNCEISFHDAPET